MSDPLPPGWTETIVTVPEFQAEIATGKYHARVPQGDIFMLMFEKRGVRMKPFELTIAPPFELMQDRKLGRVIVRQGPAV